MSGGNYRMRRGWLDHHIFDNEPFSKRDAWCYLIENACFKDTSIDINGTTVTLKRGQLSYSIRYLAEKWGWKRSKVARFLERIKTDTMIGTDSWTGQLVITICNYDKYQITPSDGGTPYGTASGTEAGQIRIKYNNTPYGGAEESPVEPPAKKLWDYGVKYLQSAGLPEKNARTFIGKLRKEHGDEASLNAIVSAQAKSVTNPVPWITTYFKNRNRASVCADMMN